jgi:predicted DNA-binding antitoxin AbrB/MazE fold protein
MISQPIRAVYQNGQLRLLDPVNLSEGEEVQLTIFSEEERELAALGDLLAEVPAPTGESMDEVDEEELARQIEEAFRGQPPLSDTIIEERRNSP